MPYLKLDAIDLRILRELQDDGRLTNTQLAERVGLSQSPCLRRVRRLEEDGFIRGYRAVVDREAIGLSLTVFVKIRLDTASQSASEALEREIARIPEVVASHMLSGDVDCIAEVVVPGIKAYEALLNDTLRRLPNVREIRSNIALKQVKAGAPLPLAHIKRDRAPDPAVVPDCT